MLSKAASTGKLDKSLQAFSANEKQAVVTRLKNRDAWRAPVPQGKPVEPTLELEVELIPTDASAEMEAAIRNARTTQLALHKSTSSSRHTYSKTCARLEALQNELKFMDEEDNIQTQLVKGNSKLADMQATLKDIEARLTEETVYTTVLRFMEERLLAQKHTERVILRDISEAVALNRTEATYVASQVVTAKSAVLDLERKLVRYKEYAARTVSSFSATRNAKERMEIARRHTLALLALPQPRSPVSASPKARPCSQPATLDRERTEDEIGYQALKQTLQRVKVSAGTVGLSAGDVIDRFREVGEASDKSEQQLQELQAHIAHLREHLERLQIRKHLPSREQDVPALLLQPIDVAAKNRRLETLRRLHEQDVDQLRFLKSLRMLVEENVKVIGAQLSQCVTLAGDPRRSPSSAPAHSFLEASMATVCAQLASLMSVVSVEAGMSPSSGSVNDSPSRLSKLMRAASLASMAAKRKDSEAILALNAVATRPRSEFNVRVRPATAGKVSQVSASTVAAAAEAYVFVHKRVSSEAGSLKGFESGGLMSPLPSSRPTGNQQHFFGSPLVTARSARSSASMGERKGSTGGPSRVLLAVAASRSTQQEGGSVISGLSSSAARMLLEAGLTLDGENKMVDQRNSPRNNGKSIHVPTEQDVKSATGIRAARKAQVLKSAAGAASIVWDAEDEVSAVKESEAVPTRDMVKLKAQHVIRRHTATPVVHLPPVPPG